jgi:hypothetical protein
MRAARKKRKATTIKAKLGEIVCVEAPPKSKVTVLAAKGAAVYRRKSTEKA